MIIGIDGGGTKTTAILASERGHILGVGKAGPANYQVIGVEKAIESILSATHEALSQAPPVTKKARVVVLGLAGVDRPIDKTRIADAFCGLRLFRDAEVIITNDAYIALVGAVGQEYGVALIAGTGAIAIGINHAGKQARVDGWGHLLGDEGSGYWIGVEALRATLRSYDSRGPSTVLGRYLLRRLGLTQPEDLVEWAYRDNPSVGAIAALTPVVFATAAEGDTVAVSILHRAGMALGHAAACVCRQLNLENEPFPFTTVGGLFKGKSSDLVLRPLQRIVHSSAPQVQWRVPRFPPEIGALIVGFSRCGLLSEELLQSLTQNMKQPPGRYL